MDRPEQTLSAVLDAGELLLTSGAEAARVEDTMRRLSRRHAASCGEEPICAALRRSTSCRARYA